MSARRKREDPRTLPRAELEQLFSISVANAANTGAALGYDLLDLSALFARIWDDRRKKTNVVDLKTARRRLRPTF